MNAIESTDRPAGDLEQEIAELRERLAEAEGVIQAIRRGDIDAVVVSSDEGERVFTLEGADHPYRTLVEGMNEGAATLTDEGVVLYSNPRLARLLATSTAELTGALFTKWVVPQHVMAFEQLLHAYGDTCASLDMILQTTGGALLPAHISLSSLTVQGTRYHCAIITDMSLAEYHAALEAAAEHVRQVNDRLREADRRKDEFLATLAHELRNPLAPIRAAAHVLKLLNSNDERLTQARDIIERQTKHMTRLIDDLLEVSRITQGKIELQRRTESLLAVIDSVADIARPSMQARQHTFRTELSEDPLLINVDAVRLSQAILNVIENAVKYTPPAGHIVLRAYRENDQALIKVEDNGVGIAAEMIPRIFEMFVQVGEHAGHHPQGGLGIGLALSRKLIEMHGGTIEAASGGLGKGSEFTIRLPLSRVGAAHVEKTDVEPAPQGTARRVLIVDDNVDAADAQCVALMLSGHTSKAVYSGAEALREYAAFQPEVVVLDIGLPDITGYEVARRLRAQAGTSRLRLIALSGWGQSEDKERALEAGFDAHLTKPVEAAILARALDG